MNPIVEVNVQSEIGKLNGVIIHTPGEEVENMTPENAERALYSDIINLSIARKEYKQISGVLSKLTKTYEVKDLLCNILKDDKIKQEVLDRIERIEPFIGEKSPKGSLKEQLLEENAENLSRLLIEGVEMVKDNLTKFLSKDWFALRPMHNFFFTRDASMSMYNEVLIGRMANSIRDRESVIMQSIFDFTPEFKTQTLTLCFGMQTLAMPITVTLSLFVVILFASIFGTAFPLLLNRMKIDPALATGPFITLTNDIIGLNIYLITGRLILTGLGESFSLHNYFCLLHNYNL
jgi:arginine deiminase